MKSNVLLSVHAKSGPQNIGATGRRSAQLPSKRLARAGAQRRPVRKGEERGRAFRERLLTFRYQRLQTDDDILLWARNPQLIWLCAGKGRKPEPQPEGRLTLKNVRDGRYSVTWRDTITNDVVLESDANTENGRLTVDTPVVTRSTAARIVRTAGH